MTDPTEPLGVDAILSALQSHALSLGQFERVGTHEPKTSPRNGLTCAIWLQGIEPAPTQSGLDSTSVCLTFNVRLFTSMLQEPQDAIDPRMVKAIDALCRAYSGDFTLDGLVECVDLLGMASRGLGGQAGYLNYGGKELRVFTLTLPLIVSDLWEQDA